MADTPRIEELKRRVQSDPASIAFAALAEEYRRAGRFDDAIAACVAGLVRHPSYLSAHVTLGRALLEVGRFDEAREELEHVLRLAPENLAAIRGLAEIHHRRGADDDHAHHTAALDAHTRREAEAEQAALAALAAPPPAEVPPPPPAPPPAVPAPPTRFAAPAPAVEAVDPGYGIFDASIAAPPHPALAGLEHFLSAINRARTERAATR